MRQAYVESQKGPVEYRDVCMQLNAAFNPITPVVTRDGNNSSEWRLDEGIVRIVGDEKYGAVLSFPTGEAFSRIEGKLKRRGFELKEIIENGN